MKMNAMYIYLVCILILIGVLFKYKKGFIEKFLDSPFSMQVNLPDSVSYYLSQNNITNKDIQYSFLYVSLQYIQQSYWKLYLQIINKYKIPTSPLNIYKNDFELLMKIILSSPSTEFKNFYYSGFMGGISDKKITILNEDPNTQITIITPPELESASSTYIIPVPSTSTPSTSTPSTSTPSTSTPSTSTPSLLLSPTPVSPTPVSSTPVSSTTKPSFLYRVMVILAIALFSLIFLLIIIAMIIGAISSLFMPQY